MTTSASAGTNAEADAAGRTPNPQSAPDITLLNMDFSAATAPADPLAAASDDADEIETLAALLANEDAREVDDPDPATLTSELPPLEPLEPFEPLGVDNTKGTPGTEGAPDAAPAAPRASDDAEATAEIDRIELAALMADDDPSETMPFTPVAPAAPVKPITAGRVSGCAKGTGTLAWGSRTDVGAIRDHNEDSFVIRFPLFAVADGMGGHEAGEVASTIAVSSLAESAPGTPDDDALGKAVEAANRAVLQGAANGVGRPGMGTTCTAVVIDGNTMAVAHVGDSRCYLLHAGQLVRVTHDHSYVEELVAAGEITPEEARIHPNRSVITRALGNDPAMKADHFTIDVVRGDRVLLCSDGLSSMVPDDVIEEAVVSTTTPQACADALVDLALKAGGHDNVTCVVVDVKDDGIASHALKARLRNVLVGVALALVVLLGAFLALYGVARNTWYLIDDSGYVALYRGLPGCPDFLGFNEMEETTPIQTTRLSNSLEQRLRAGITFSSEEEARAAINSYAQMVQDSTAAPASTPSTTEKAS